MKLRMKYLCICFLIGAFFSSSCKEYLNEKPMKSAVVPKTMDDLEALLNQEGIVSSSSAVNEIVADDYYVGIADWQYLMSRSINTPANFGDCLSYIWDNNAMQKSWMDGYRNPIYYANVVLDVAMTIKTNDETRLDKIKGSALFYRAFALERLAQVYCKPHTATANKDLGLVLRLTSDINEPTKRATVQETYDQIIRDLEKAAELLPHTVKFPTHPKKASAYGALARVYLSMRNYPKAGYYADLCLKVNSSLMDYNNIDPEGEPIFIEYNEEVVFHNNPIPSSILASPRAKVNPDLYQSYKEGDLRKKIFFAENEDADLGTFSFKGSYSGRFGYTDDVFDGITTAEMFLIRAESYARSGDKESALRDLNTLLIKRWVNDGSFIPILSENSDEALSKILIERRKELVFRGLRWTDLRRLNEEDANITLARVLDGVTYTLPHGDLRWTLLIPEEVILHSTISQNPR